MAFPEEALHLHRIAFGHWDDVPDAVPSTVRDGRTRTIYNLVLYAMRSRGDLRRADGSVSASIPSVVFAGGRWLVIKGRYVGTNFMDEFLQMIDLTDHPMRLIDLFAVYLEHDPLFRARIDPYAAEYILSPSRLRLPKDFAYWIPIVEPPRPTNFNGNLWAPLLAADDELYRRLGEPLTTKECEAAHLEVLTKALAQYPP